MIKYEDIEGILNDKLKGDVMDKDDAAHAIMELIRKGARLGLSEVVAELDVFEKLSFEKVPVNMVKITLSRAEDAEEMAGWSDSSVMPMDHHCDPERLISVIQFLRERMNKLYNG